MALIRGTQSLCPCPICLVPNNKQSDLSDAFPLRTAKDSRAIISRAREMSVNADKEDLLKTYGLRNVDVCLPFPREHDGLTACLEHFLVY